MDIKKCISKFITTIDLGYLMLHKVQCGLAIIKRNKENTTLLKERSKYNIIIRLARLII